MAKLCLYKIINNFFLSNTYIIYRQESKKVWLIDCGDVEPIKQWIMENDKEIGGVFITHSHFDHIYGLNDLKLCHPDIIVYTSANGTLGLSSSRLNLSLFHEQEFEYAGGCTVLKEGDQIELYPNLFLHVYETIGHDWSCLSYAFSDYFFSGDSYISGVKTVANFPKSNKNQAKESVDRILGLSKFYTFLCPGHGDILKN